MRQKVMRARRATRRRLIERAIASTSLQVEGGTLSRRSRRKRFRVACAGLTDLAAKRMSVAAAVARMERPRLRSLRELRRVHASESAEARSAKAEAKSGAVCCVPETRIALRRATL